MHKLIEETAFKIYGSKRGWLFYLMGSKPEALFEQLLLPLTS